MKYIDIMYYHIFPCFVSWYKNMKNDQKLYYFSIISFCPVCYNNCDSMHCGSLVFVDVNRNNVSFNPVFLHPLNAHALWYNIILCMRRNNKNCTAMLPNRLLNCSFVNPTLYWKSRVMFKRKLKIQCHGNVNINPMAIMSQIR